MEGLEVCVAFLRSRCAEGALDGDGVCRVGFAFWGVGGAGGGDGDVQRHRGSWCRQTVLVAGCSMDAQDGVSKVDVSCVLLCDWWMEWIDGR